MGTMLSIRGDIIYGDYVKESDPTPANVQQDLELLADQAARAVKGLPPIRGPVHIHWLIVAKPTRKGLVVQRKKGA